LAVYEKTYRPYAGELTPQRWRFLVLPRYAFSEVMRSRFFTAFVVVAALVYPLALGLVLYVPHNLGFLKTFQIDPVEVASFFKFDGAFFLRFFMIPAGLLGGFIVSLVVGPTLISSDLRNNGLPLYLARPFSRTEYILGKMSVLLILLSVITWVPGLFLFGLQSYLGGTEWLSEHWRLGPALFLGSAIWILVLTLVSLALSAHLRWKAVAQAGLLGVFFILPVAAHAMNALFDTNWGSLLNFGNMIRVIWGQLFSAPTDIGVSSGAAWASLLGLCVACLAVLARRVRAYEVVRS
jgi:ABC-2 type transport system permease protein